ncbi:transposase, partial [Comamonas halotolerans]
YACLSRRQLDLNEQVPCTCSSAGLHLLVDSAGIKCLGKASGNAKRWG